jgi:hypothetical protein
MGIGHRLGGKIGVARAVPAVLRLEQNQYRYQKRALHGWNHLNLRSSARNSVERERGYPLRYQEPRVESLMECACREKAKDTGSLAMPQGRRRLGRGSLIIRLLSRYSRSGGDVVTRAVRSGDQKKLCRRSGRKARHRGGSTKGPTVGFAKPLGPVMRI